MEKRFERKTEQKTPTNPTADTKTTNRSYELEKETIKKQQSKK